jgi:hypothetical protein
MVEKVDKDDDQVESGFTVEIKKPQKSVFDDDKDQHAADLKRMEELKQVTIDDDEPDYEKDDEYGKTRLHACAYPQGPQRDARDHLY